MEKWNGSQQSEHLGPFLNQASGISKNQGRRRVFKSGPAEEIIECRRHEWGRAREGDSPSR